MAAVIDLRKVQNSLDKSLNLFRRTYSASSSGGGGWYHRLDVPNPGPSATAVGLNSLYVCGCTDEHLTDGLSFLKARQVRAEDPLRNGGWAVNTSLGYPVTEATSWVARFLGLARLGLVPDAPNTQAAFAWLVGNQNEDGGWGSFLGQPSRVWLTCMALRALAQLNPLHASVNRGIEWLLTQQSDSLAAWGEKASSPPTVTHTAFVLLTLADLRARMRNRNIADTSSAAYDWLVSNVKTDSVYDDAARVENYNVTHDTAEGKVTWHASVWHPGLPFVISALIRHPIGAPANLLCAGVRTIVENQADEGYWPNLDGAAGISVWAVWPFVQALSDVARYPVVRTGDRITWLSSEALVLQRGGARDERISSLVAGTRRAELRELGRRHWATSVLVLFVILGLGGLALHVLEWKDFALGLVLPVILLVIQERQQRQRKGATSRGKLWM